MADLYKKVYDGDDINSDVLLDIRGSISGDGIARSTGNKMLLYFHTDSGTSYYGYRAYYSAINPGNVSLVYICIQFLIPNNTIFYVNYVLLWLCKYNEKK